MTLTDEQLSVVNLASGRHLVLAPPGSGKTEMLSSLRKRLKSAYDAIVPRHGRRVDFRSVLAAFFVKRGARCKLEKGKIK